MRSSRVSLAAAVIAGTIIALGLTACGGADADDGQSSPKPSGSKSPTASPSSTASASPQAGSITIGRTGLVVTTKDGSALATIPFTSDADEAVAQLTKLIGAQPAVTTQSATLCSFASTTESWGTALELRIDDSAGEPVAVHFVASSRQKQVGASIAVETANGFGVGDSIANFIAVSPASSLVVRSDPTYGSEVFYDLDPSTQDAAVAISAAENGPITLLSAPGNVNQDC